jgi:hypothetical protein
MDSIQLFGRGEREEEGGERRGEGQFPAFSCSQLPLSPMSLHDPPKGK